MAHASIVVVGLGPGNPRHITTETVAEIARIEHRYLRTAQHPSATLVPGATCFDGLYERADRFSDVYAEIVERLVDAAQRHGEILYAVPGSPLILERAVADLIADQRVSVEALPAVSFLDLVWARLGLDPVEAGVRLVDGHRFAEDAAGHRGALLVAHTHANWVLSDIKLSIDEVEHPHIGETPAILLRALGTDDEQIVHTTWAHIDQAIEADHLTSLYIPALDVPVAAGYQRFHQLARTLREQCPWDIEQDHHSLVPYLIEETYEVVDAIAALDPADPTTDEALIEELGDLLYQIEFHATIAEQEGRFTIADITAGIHDKLVHRHPHVFAPSTEQPAVDDAATVLANWDQIKMAEKGRTSVFDGVPTSLPALAYAHKLQHKAAKVGFDWPDVNGALAKIAEEADELVAARRADDTPAIIDELGDLLFSVVNVARHLGVDPEGAARQAAQKFRSRFEYVEQAARRNGLDLAACDLGTLESMWVDAKRATR